MKIDVEGLETALIENLSPDSLKKIDHIYAETIYNKNLPGFEKEQYGDVVRFRKTFNAPWKLPGMLLHEVFVVIKYR